MSFELLDYKVSPSDSRFPIRLQRNSEIELTKSFERDICDVINKIGLGRSVYFPHTISRSGVGGPVIPLSASSFWRNEDTPIPWSDMEIGDVVVFNIAGSDRENQLWIVKLTDKRRARSREEYIFSYLLVVPWRSEYLGKTALLNCAGLHSKIGYTGRINGPESWTYSATGTVYFFDARKRGKSHSKLYWTKLDRLCEFINWGKVNPLEVKS